MAGDQVGVSYGARRIPRLGLDRLRRHGDVSSAAPGWRWSVLTLEPVGRIALPAEVGDVVAGGGTLRAVSQSGWLLLRPSGGMGSEVSVDRRRRLSLPTWLRRRCAMTGQVLVGVTTFTDSY